MKTRIFIFLLLNAFLMDAQTVSFTDQSDLLESFSGFSYNDCAVDMNGDFLDDVVRVSINQIYIDYQQQDGTFEQRSFTLNLLNEPDWSICAGDLDENGYNDLLFGGGSAVSFVMANDSGTMYTEKPFPEFIFSQRTTMADIDNDGDLDAFVCHDTDQSHPYRNDGTGNMELDQSLIETADRAGNYAAIWTDYDNDNDIDLYITKCKGGALPGDIDRTNLLYRNNGDSTFTEVAEAAGVADNAQSWSTVFEDFDNDGDFDAFIVNHDMKNRFYLNNGDGTFTDIIQSTGIAPGDLGAWENAAADFNNDGFVDIFSELNNQLYLNNGDLTFTGYFLSSNGSIITPGSIADLNNDGFLDVIRNEKLYINDGNDNNWLKINTIGVESNRNGIGARVEIYGTWGRQIREVRAGQSFAPMSSLQTHFGIGQADSIEKVVVKWPSGIISTVENPLINTTLTIQESSCLLPPTALTTSGPTEICEGTSVQLIAPEGFAGYIWSTGETTRSITVDNPGFYQATLSDTAGCVSTSDQIAVTFIEEVNPAIVLTGEDIFCEGSTATLSVTEGSNPIWSNGQTGDSIQITESGTYTVAVDALCAVDPITSPSETITVLDAPLPMVDGLNIIQGETAEITATGDSLHWYDMPTGGTLLGTGSPFITDPLDMTATYYVESLTVYAGEQQSGGKTDNTGGGGLGSLAHLIFSTWEPFQLQTVKIYVLSPIQGNILLIAENGDVLAQKAIDLPIGEHVVELDFDVPVATNLSLRSTSPQLFRNNGGVNYPYPIGEVGEITGSSFGSSWYYYFYDWKIKKEDITCISERVPVTVEVTDAQEAFRQAGFSVFPNPAADEIFVKMEDRAEKLAILDVQGRLVYEKETPGLATEKITLKNMAPGIYLIRIMAAGKLYHAKFVKE
ncbi:MAG: FG-GAP-like repeat-containing protein [Bacteroidota bacterium]